MRSTLLLLTILLSACGTLPGSQSLPEIPPELAKPCPALQTIPGDTTTLATLMSTVAKNYMARHECAAQLDALQGWYADQKKIFDKVNE